MKNAAQGIFCLLLVLSLLLSPAGAAAQTPPPPDRSIPVPVGQLGELQPWPLAGWPGESGPLPHALEAFSDPLVSVIVQFEGQALGERVAERGPMAARDQRNYVAALRSRQVDVLSRVQQAGGAVVGQFTKAYNGVQVRVPASELAALRAMAGVKAVHPVRTYYPALDHSTEIIRADEVWALDGGGFTGDGVTIAVIDTGIDYTHAAFGGPGTASAYTSNNKSILETGTFPTAKVVGGWDFAGTAYTGSNDPIPDPDPLDEHGHGTHVASTAAGFSAGAVAQGVAPDAKLYALKVFGASGSTGLVYLALEWCMDPDDDPGTDDRVDVINLSLGAPFGTGDPADPEVAMIEQLAALGTVVVAASGNDGDVEYVTGSPASADSAISVAATTSSGVGDDLVAYFSSRGPRGFDSALKPEIAAPGTDIFAAAMGSGAGGRTMEGTSMATPHVTGVAALVRQAHPEWTPEQIKAALMNTAVDFNGFSARLGAGRVDALRAVTTDTVAVGDPKLVSLSWGVIEFSEALFSAPQSKRVTVQNFDAQEKTYTISCSWTGCHERGAQLTMPASITVPANGKTASFDVGLQLNAVGVLNSLSWLSEYYGLVRLENQDPANPNDQLIIPFYFIPRPHNNLAATELLVDRTTATGSIIHNGMMTSSPEIWPVYSIDPNEPDILDHGDLRMVMMDYDAHLDRIMFGFNFYSARPNPIPAYGIVYLAVDVDHDNFMDYVFFNRSRNGVGVIDLKHSGQIQNTPYLIDYNLNSGIMFWPLVPNYWYGIGPENSSFTFCVYSLDFTGNIDVDTSCHQVDYLQRPFTAHLTPRILSDGQTAALELRADSVAGTLYNRPIGAAIVELNGTAGVGQATFLPFEFDFLDVYMPLILR